MRHFKKYVALLLVTTTFSFLMASCGEQNNSSSSVIQKGNLYIEGATSVGLREYIELTAKINDVKEDVRWESSNKEVATISSTGLVKGISVGEATITATSKKDESKKATYAITVRESMQIGLVFNRFVNSTYYELDATGNVLTSSVQGSMAFHEDYYENSYFFTPTLENSLLLPSYGLGNDQVGTYVYNMSNDTISQAIYLRSSYTSYKDVLMEMNDINSVGVSLTSISLREDNTYEVTNTSMMGLFFYMWTQNLDVNQSALSSLQSSLAQSMQSATIHITSPYSFEVSLNFASSVQDAKLTFSHLNENNKNTLLENYLSNHAVTYPEVDPAVLSMKELAKNHNYYRDLGTYTDTTTGTKTPIGKVYYSEDGIYYDFNEEYIDITGIDAYDYGYVNISGKEGYEDGFYAFTNKRNEKGEQEFVLGKMSQESSYSGKRYTKYYEYIENLTLVTSYLEGKEYTFTPVSTSDYDSTYHQFTSDAEEALNICYSIFSDEINAFDATPVGLMLAVHIDEENASNSVVNYGIYMAVSGNYGYLYSSYAYSGFGSVTIPVIENFLASL